MKKILYLFLFCIFSSNIFAQNTLQNPSFSVADWAAGVYIVSLETEFGIWREKIVVE